jgi:plasmid stabilization system protein ParE
LPSSKRLRISGPARHDLERIGEYTRAEWGAAQRRKYLGQIKDGFKAVRDTPGIGARRDDIHEGLRAHPVRKHVIFYRETKSDVTVVRVLHQSMSPDLRL